MEPFSLPCTFVFRQEYVRWPHSHCAVVDFGDHPLGKSTGEWETETFSKGSIITIVEQTKSLLGVRWKTDDGKRFSPDELDMLLAKGALEQSAVILKLPRPE